MKYKAGDKVRIMTREEQIYNAAADHRDCVCCGFYDPHADAQERSFIEGAEWADEHPKEGLVDINKACKYLESKIRMYTSFDDTCEFIDNFRKAMEE